MSTERPALLGRFPSGNDGSVHAARSVHRELPDQKLELFLNPMLEDFRRDSHGAVGPRGSSAQPSLERLLQRVGVELQL